MKRDKTKLQRRREHVKRQVDLAIEKGIKIEYIVCKIADELFLSESTIWKDLKLAIEDSKIKPAIYDFESFLNELPKDIRERFLNNMLENDLDRVKYKKGSFESFCKNCFIWNKTQEAFQYWLNVSYGRFDKARELLTDK